MSRKERIERHTAESLAAKRIRGETRSDWTRAAAMSREAIEADAAADPDERDMEIDWASASVEMPRPKAELHMRVDRDVLDFFRNQGRGYQTRINAVLRSYVTRMRHE